MKRQIFSTIFSLLCLCVWSQINPSPTINDLTITKTYNGLSITTPRFNERFFCIANYPIGVYQGIFRFNIFNDETCDVIIESYYETLSSKEEDEEDDVIEVYEDEDIFFLFYGLEKKLKCKGNLYKSHKFTQVAITENYSEENKTLVIDLLSEYDIRAIVMANEDGTVPALIQYRKLGLYDDFDENNYEIEAADNESDYTHTSQYFSLIFNYIYSLLSDQ